MNFIFKSITGRKTSHEPTMSKGTNAVPSKHFVLDAPLDDEFKDYDFAMFGMGCFWGAERKFWQHKEGIISTSVGYAGGKTENPTYEQVCSGTTNHAEVVRIVFDPKKTTYKALLDIFWGNHDPTTLNRQGNDVGTQYRSAAYYYNDEQKKQIEMTKAEFNKRLAAEGYGQIVTEIKPAPTYHFAEDYHQQYLAKNPGGYCGLGGTGCYKPGDVNDAMLGN
eukprot:Clim_evm37s88 gene=Clim_evmTU37s88